MSISKPTWFHKSLFVIFSIVNVCTYATDENVRAGCEAPPAFADAPGLQAASENLCTRITGNMDFKTGAGTGALARDLRALTDQFGGELESVPAGEFSKLLSFKDLREFVLDSTQRKGLVLQVINYSQAIATGNLRLHRAGIDFVQLEQAPKARLVELFRDLTARFSKSKVTIEEIKALSDKQYDNGEKQIRLPIESDVLAGAAEKFPNHVLITSLSEPAEDELLPSLEKPLKNDEAKYATLLKYRLGIGMGVAFIGGTIGGGASIAGAVSGLAAAALEYQFAKLSPQWAVFWNRFGFKGNVAVNAMYGVIVTSVMVATQMALGQVPELTLKEFLVKSVAVGTTAFVASFGAMQIAAAQMTRKGEFSEYKRFLLEFASVLWNNFGRALGLTAAGFGATVGVGELLEVKFNSGEAIGWGIQGSYLALVTAPFWLKALMGDYLYDELTRYELAHLGDPKHRWNRSWLGRNVRYPCAKAVAWMSNLYTPNRVRKVTEAAK